MQFGDEIKMVRDYDRGVGLVEGAVLEVAGSDDPEVGMVSPGLADALTQEANDGNGPYATRIETDDEESE